MTKSTNTGEKLEVSVHCSRSNNFLYTFTKTSIKNNEFEVAVSYEDCSLKAKIRTDEVENGMYVYKEVDKPSSIKVLLKDRKDYKKFCKIVRAEYSTSGNIVPSYYHVEDEYKAIMQVR